ncbi:Dihydropteroate synthase [[Actinomadura] parvosata subsp. kistnae]|nr:Dihydropteroate synthase [Actinomadura parvosata subsp. kistnae]
MVTEVREELSKRVDLVLAEGGHGGADRARPGPRFAKNAEHNWACWRHPAPGRAGLPAAHRASRKRFLGGCWPIPTARHGRSAAATTHAGRDALAAHAGAWCVRVHEVGPNADAVRVAAAWKRAGAGT